MLKAARPAGKRSLPSYRVKREQFRNGPEVTVWAAILDYILIWKNIIFQTFHVRTSVSIWPTGLDQLLLRCRKITRNWVNLSISQQWSRKSLFDWHRSERFWADSQTWLLLPSPCSHTWNSPGRFSENTNYSIRSMKHHLHISSNQYLDNKC